MFKNMRRMMGDEKALGTLCAIWLSIVGAIIGMATGPFNMFCGAPIWIGGWIGGALGFLYGAIFDMFIPVFALIYAFIAAVFLTGSLFAGCIPLSVHLLLGAGK